MKKVYFDTNVYNDVVGYPNQPGISGKEFQVLLDAVDRKKIKILFSVINMQEIIDTRHNDKRAQKLLKISRQICFNKPLKEHRELLAKEIKASLRREGRPIIYMNIKDGFNKRVSVWWDNLSEDFPKYKNEIDINELYQTNTRQKNNFLVFRKDVKKKAQEQLNKKSLEIDVNKLWDSEKVNKSFEEHLVELIKKMEILTNTRNIHRKAKKILSKLNVLPITRLHLKHTLASIIYYDFEDRKITRGILDDTLHIIYAACAKIFVTDETDLLSMFELMRKMKVKNMRKEKIRCMNLEDFIKEIKRY